MAFDRTSGQVEQRYVETMGPELGKFFNRLWNECVWLHWKWDEYVSLFGTNQQRVDLMNTTAGGFFAVVNDCLWDDVLLHIARLTDPVKVSGRATLTLQRLPGLVAPEIRDEVRKQLDAVAAKAQFARDRRNRHIGHRELALALREGAKPLEPASRKMVREAIEAIATLLNTVELHYGDTSVAYEYSGLPGNAVALLHVLRDGVRFAEERDRREDAGEMRPEDWSRDPPL